MPAGLSLIHILLAHGGGQGGGHEVLVALRGDEQSFLRVGHESAIHFNDGGPSARGVETFTLAPAGTSSSMSRNIRQDALQGNSQDSMNIALATAVQGHMLKGCLLYTSRCV